MENEIKHHKFGFANCKECAILLAIEEQNLNVYWCDKCKKSSIATKPVSYSNCPCGSNLITLI